MTKYRKFVALLLVIVLAVSVGAVSVGATTLNKNSVSADEKVGITVHFKSTEVEPYIYYWNSLPQNIETTYPGVKMTKDATQGEGWYTYTFDKLTKVNMIFTDKDGKQLNSQEIQANGGCIKTEFGVHQTPITLTVLKMLIFVRRVFTL